MSVSRTSFKDDILFSKGNILDDLKHCRYLFGIWSALGYISVYPDSGKAFSKVNELARIFKLGIPCPMCLIRLMSILSQEIWHSQIYKQRYDSLLDASCIARKYASWK